MDGVESCFCLFVCLFIGPCQLLHKVKKQFCIIGMSRIGGEMRDSNHTVERYPWVGRLS